MKALVDTGASHNFLEVKEADRLGIKYTKEKGLLKVVNSKAKTTFGVARGVKVSLGEWKGLVDFSIVPMDDYAIVLGIDFMDQVSVVPIPCANTMCILEEGNVRMVPLAREASLQAKRLSAIQLFKGVKKVQPTFLVALKEDEDMPTNRMPKEISNILEEFKDVMPPELPKKLPSKREVDHIDCIGAWYKPTCRSSI